MNEEFLNWRYRRSVDDGLPLSKKIAFGILNDITDRRGLSDAWDEIDDEIKGEIIKEWVEWVEGCLSQKPEV